MILAAATLLIGVLIGFYLGGWTAARYRRRWREALALLTRLDDGNGLPGLLSIPPHVLRALRSHRAAMSSSDE